MQFLAIPYLFFSATQRLHEQHACKEGSVAYFQYAQNTAAANAASSVHVTKPNAISIIVATAEPCPATLAGLLCLQSRSGSWEGLCHLALHRPAAVWVDRHYGRTRLL